MYYGIYAVNDGTVFVNTRTATSAVLSITPLPESDKITIDSVNGFALKYSSSKEIFEITKGELHIKVWSCGQMEVEKWSDIFRP